MLVIGASQHQKKSVIFSDHIATFYMQQDICKFSEITFCSDNLGSR